MNPTESEGNLMQVLTGILEDSVQTLKRIEKAVNESTKIAREMLDRIELIDKKIESGFVAVVKKALPDLEHKFLEKIDNIGGGMGDLNSILPAIVTKIQQSLQILSIHNLIKDLDTLPPLKKKETPEKQTKQKKSSTKPASATPVSKPPPSPETAAPNSTPKEESKEEESSDHLLKPSSFFGS
ncbi:MAG: hypothetical protein ACTSRS_00800 [Candidatus Helarchaeota archaeon]